ncbi:MAG: Glucose/arabinose dehydrogenase, beta-propeller fold [Candidatus Nitrotoga sp. SPKER]|nr:MAG: Glucose/arabinose dehydrogenase, beta-propeller fold [Candidatus Nitrotoga sp. SPKER]
MIKKNLYSRRLKLSSSLAMIIIVLALAGCGSETTLPTSAGIGHNPTLPPPQPTLFPTVHVAPAKGWPINAKPVPAPGTNVTRFAEGLDHPRWIYVLPNGDVLIAETNAPPKPEDGKGIKGWFMKKVMGKAGATVPSANRISLLRDSDGDGISDVRFAFLEGLNSPFGMTLVGNDFYVANTDAVIRYPYKPGDTKISAPGVKVMDLPAGPINHHWTKSLIASLDGTRLYVTVGSNSNVGENGIEKEEGRAAIWELNLRTGIKRIFASGLRNPNGMAWEVNSGALWTTVNERDELGNDLVPDYMTSVQDGGFYGWPYSYFGQHVDTRVNPPRPDLVAKAIYPDYALGSHTASLGLTSAQGTSLPTRFHNGMFVGQHGSWNRKPHSGYKVIFIPFSNGHPTSEPVVDVLTGFITKEGDALGRPVGVALDKRGALLVADDVGNIIWRVTSAAF